MRARPAPTHRPAGARARRFIRLAALLFAAARCGGEEPAEDPTSPYDPVDPDDPDDGPCPTPERLVGDRCVEPGVQDDGCPAGALGVDGECLPAGMPPSACLDGFVHDGDRGCIPVLPDAPCPAGEMALVGETTCRAVMDCGTSTWGDIPVEADTVYVDGSLSGGKGEGTVDKPFTSITDAVAAAPDGAIIAVAAGTYYDLFLIDRPVRLWGRCPSMVRLAGVFPDMAQMVIDADGVEVHGIAMTGPGGGIVLADDADILLDRLWLHDLTDTAIGVAQAMAPTSVTITSSLIEGATEIGIAVFGTSTAIRDTVVRDTNPNAGGEEGRGINVQPSSTGAAATLDVEGVVIRGSGNHGLFASDADLFVRRTVVLDTLGQPIDGDSGIGILAQSTGEAPTPTASITSSYVGASHYFGVASVNVNLGIDGLFVDDTRPQLSDMAGGIPLAVLTEGSDQVALVRAALLQGGSSIGLSARGLGIALEGVAIRGIEPDAAAGTAGVGLVMRTSDDVPPGQLSARGIHVDSMGDFGVYVGGAQAVLEGLAVEVGAGEGWGVFSVHEGPAFLPSDVTLTGSVVTGARGFGVSAFASRVTLEGTAVHDTVATTEGTFGDGVGVTSLDDDGVPLPASASLRSSRVSDNERGGISSFGGAVELRRTSASCNVLDLTAQTFHDQSAVFEDLGANLCGCPEGSDDCQVRSSEVSPPQAPASPARGDAPLGTPAPEPPIP